MKSHILSNMTDVRKSNMMSDGITYTRNLILRGMSGIYLIAFLSFYYQSAGLFGSNGIAPAPLQIESTKSISTNIIQKPTLLYFAPYFGLDTEYMLDILALLGSLLAFAGFVSQSICILPTFTILWCLYGSLIQVAQPFTNQSDYLLLEAGFILILLAPLTRTNQASTSDKVIFILLRWLLVRFLFACGVVKLFSHCPHWWNFTAWYSHNLLFGWWKVMNIFANITEVGCVWLSFFPHRTVRRYVFYWQMFVQFNIIITGNYGFLNFMLVILMLSLLDDQFLAKQNMKRVLVLLTKVLLFEYLLFFGIVWNSSQTSIDQVLTQTLFLMLLSSSPVYASDLITTSVLIYVLLLNGVKFEEKYLEMLRKTIRPAPLFAASIIISTFLKNLVSHPVITNARKFVQKIYGVNISFSMIALSMVILSMVPHGNLDTSTNITNTDLGSFYQQMKKFHIVNEYGQEFRKMRNERYEIIYEHAEDLNGPWIKYEFLYKPTNENSSLHFIGIHFPRLDFKFYTASTSNYRKESWTISLAYRLLQEQRRVLALLSEKSPVPVSPKYVRGSLYKFRYTNLFSSPTNYWIRFKMSEYFPAFSLDNISPYLRSMKISPNYKAVEVKNRTVKMVLDFIRNHVHFIGGNLLIFSVLLAGFVVIVTRKCIAY